MRAAKALLSDFRGLPRPFWVLFAGTLVNRVGGFVLVFLAIYLTEVRGLTPAQAGAIISAYGLGAIGGGPLAGALADRCGRRPTLVGSLIAGGASMLGLGFVTRTLSMTIAPQPAKTRPKVPTNSAPARCSGEMDTQVIPYSLGGRRRGAPGAR